MQKHVTVFSKQKDVFFTEKYSSDKLVDNKRVQGPYKALIKSPGEEGLE